MAPAEQIEFPYDDLTVVAARMDELRQAQRGWVNLLPEVVDDEGDSGGRSRTGLLASLFRSGGPPVPMATWLAATGRKPSSIGIEHGLRSRVGAILREHDTGLPAGWAMVQDNARRGLVVRLPAEAGADEVLAWLMGAVDVLCPHQLTGAWLAEVHER